MEEHETFWTLLKDPAHWQFEIFLIVLFDVIIGMMIWPYLRRWFRHHKSDDEKIAMLEQRMANLEQKIKAHSD